MMALYCYQIMFLNAMKEEFSEGDLNRRGYCAFALECKVFSITADGKSVNEKEYGEMW